MPSALTAVTPVDTPRAGGQKSDATLMCAWIEGDADAFDHIHARYRERLWRLVRRSTSDEELARELYQDIWMRVIDRRDDWQPSGRLLGWLFTIARHRIADHYRSQARRPAPKLAGEPIETAEVDVDDVLPEASVTTLSVPLSPQRQAELAEDHATVTQALARLPEAQCEAVLLHHVAGMTLDEIGQATGHKREAVKSRLRYGIHRLRQILGADS